MDKFFQAVIEANIQILKLIESTEPEKLYEKLSLGEGGDMSTFADIEAEKIFINYLSEFGNIYSEECGWIEGESSDEIIIDPIDGSDNFISNHPYFGTSVARTREGKCIQACVVNLANKDIFIKDRKSFQKGNLLKKSFEVVKKNPFSKIGLFERAYCSKKTPENMRKNFIKYRSPGAFALSLAYGHEVDFVLYEGTMRPFDIEAGLFMCEDLHLLKRKDLLLVSKDKEIFDKISQFI